MSNTYTWTVVDMERASDTGAVNVVHWHCSGHTGSADDGDLITATRYGSINLNPDPDAADFIQYDSLTEATVLEWVHGQIDKAAIETAIADDITAQSAPASLTGKPWS